MDPLTVVMLGYSHVKPANLASFRRAAERRGIRLEEWEPHDITVWCDGSRSTPLYRDRETVPPVVVHRTISRLSGVVVPALLLWQQRGAVVLNDPVWSLVARDKLACALRLIDAGVPVVPSLGFHPSESTKLERCGAGPVVVKPAHGLEGRGVTFHPSASDGGATRALEDADAFVREHFVAQPVVGSPGTDIRAFVVSGRCVAMMRRHAAPAAGGRANLSLGGRGMPLDVHHPAAAIAVSATAALHLDYAGVDLVETDEGIAVLEVDAWAGFSGLEQVTQADVSGAILDAACGLLARR
jgi:RimK family alpha-L-glutamate ligase